MTDPTDPQANRPDAPNHHRRRRGPGDPTTTGSIPIVRTEPDLPDPTIEYRHPERTPSPYLEVHYAGDDVFTDPVPRRTAAPVTPADVTSPADLTPTVATPTVDTPAVATPAVASGPVSGRPMEAPVTTPVPVAPRPGPPPVAGDFDILDAAAQAPVTSPAGLSAPSRPAPLGDLPGDAPTAVNAEQALPDGAPGLPERKRNRGLLWGLLAAALVAVVAVGYFGLRHFGYLESSEDFDSATGSGGVVVQIPEAATLSQFGSILADAGVVASQQAFISAADGRPLSAGFYELPTGISAAAAVEMMKDDSHRVGRMVIPEGLQLDTKKGVDGKSTPGIFELIADATAFEIDGTRHGVTVAELEKVAATTPAAELGVPSWAVAPVENMKGDHRRLEGLIASGAWEDVDPRLSAKELLRSLVTRSAERFASWGILTANDSGLLPYDTLVVASIVEREVSQPDDYAKVARVILNRLAKEQRLEMDSTVNYTAAVTDIDVRGETFTDKTEWNTYQRDGLPITPIGAVGERALQAVEKPAAGDWLYFVTVDKKGTTLFAKTFEKHKQNRQVACDNKLISTGCE